MPHFLRSTQFSSRPELDGNYVVFNETSGAGFVMNGGSYEIWQLCDGTRDIEAITSDLVQRRSTGVPGDVQEIVSKHIEILTAAGLVEKREN